MLDLLVHCQDFETFSSAPRHAAHLAAALDAHLTGLYIAPRIPRALPDAPPSLTEELLGFAHNEIDRAEHARAAFGHMAHGCGARRWDWQVALGHSADCLIAAGNWNDLAVLEYRDQDPRFEMQTIADVLLAGIACLVVRENGTNLPPPLRRVAIAWNGSVEAIRAVHAALPILRQARQIHVLVSPPPASGSRIILEPEFSLERYLRQHGLEIQSMALATDQRSPEDAILVESARIGADLLVMGAFGSGRIRHGQHPGTTRYLLERSSLPLLLSH